MPNEFSNTYTGIGNFEGTFNEQFKDDTKSYQVPSRHIALALQEPLKRTRKVTRTTNNYTMRGR